MTYISSGCRQSPCFVTLQSCKFFPQQSGGSDAAAASAHDDIDRRYDYGGGGGGGAASSSRDERRHMGSSAAAPSASGPQTAPKPRLSGQALAQHEFLQELRGRGAK